MRAAAKGPQGAQGLCLAPPKRGPWCHSGRGSVGLAYESLLCGAGWEDIVMAAVSSPAVSSTEFHWIHWIHMPLVFIAIGRGGLVVWPSCYY